MLTEGSSPPPEHDAYDLPTIQPGSPASLVNTPNTGQPPPARKRKRAAPAVTASSPAPSDLGSTSGAGNPVESVHLFMLSRFRALMMQQTAFIPSGLVVETSAIYFTRSYIRPDSRRL